MTDDPYDKMLDDTVADYNRPGAVPRDEMWAKIQAARSAAPAPARSTPYAARLARLGIAALLILSAGILIGRRMGTSDSTRVADATAPKRDSSPSQPATLPGVDSPTKTVATLPSSEGTDAVPRTTGDADADAIAYRLVVLQHLAGTEAAITAFRSAARRGEVDPQVARWSRELLSTTRMLRSSSLADDPMMRRLLTDLDLILAQIAAYSERGTTRPEELDLIEESISKRGIISKLRTTIPARVPGNSRGL